MNATSNTVPSADVALARAAAGLARFVFNVGDTSCEVRARTVAMITEVLGFEQEMEDAAAVQGDHAADGRLIADLLDSRMIAPPRSQRRRQRHVSSRAMFYGVAGH